MNALKFIILQLILAHLARFQIKLIYGYITPEYKRNNDKI